MSGEFPVVPISPGMTEPSLFEEPIEHLPGAGITALATYSPRRLSVATWAVWRDRVIDLAGRLCPDHGVNARNMAAAISETIRMAAPADDAPLMEVLSDANSLLVVNDAKRRNLAPTSIHNLQDRLEQAKRACLGLVPSTPETPEKRKAPVGRLAALQLARDDDDPFVRDAARRVLAGLSDLTCEPWNCPLTDKEWKRFRKAMHERGITETRWRWSEVKNERIRAEFSRLTPAATVLQFVGNASRLDQIIKWSEPDVQVVASGLRGSANLFVPSWTVDAMAVRTLPNSGIVASTARPTKAEAKRLAAEARRLQTQAPAPLKTEFEEMLATWVPRKLPMWEWMQCRDLVHSVMRRATHITGKESFGKHLRLVADFVNWARMSGYDLDWESLFVERVIDDYIRRGIKHTARTANDYRKDLRNLAAHINDAPGAPNRSVRIPHAAVKPPYTSREVGQIMRLIDLEADTRFKRRIQVAVALGLGAGLSAQDMRQLSRGHIDDFAADGILIRVPGDRPREVWMRRDYEALLRSGLEGLTRNEHVLGRRSMGKDALVDLYKRIQSLADGPDLLQGRMRNTWLAHLMCEPIPLWTVMQAAGLNGARSLTDIAQYLQPVTDVSLTRGNAA